MADGEKVTPKKVAEWAPIFLKTLAETANVRAACNAAGIARKTAYQHRNRSEVFAAKWDEALDEACDILEAAARERALTMSDTLLIFLLKAHRPALYRETSRHELAGADGGGLLIEIVARPDDAKAAD